MCRNIKTLFNFDPPATEEEIRAASLQFVRKLSGFNKPSKANEEAFDSAIESVTEAATELLKALTTTAEPKSREAEAAKARARQRKSVSARFERMLDHARPASSALETVLGCMSHVSVPGN